MPEFYYFSDSSSEGGYTPRHGEVGGDDDVSEDDSVVMDDPVDGPPDTDDEDDPNRDLEEIDPTLLPWYERPPVYQDIPATWLRDGLHRITSNPPPGYLGRVMAKPLKSALGGYKITDAISDIDVSILMNPNPGNPLNRSTTVGDPVFITVPVWSHLSTAPVTPYVITMKFKIRQSSPGDFDLRIGQLLGLKLGSINNKENETEEQEVEMTIDPSLDPGTWDTPGIKAVIIQIDLYNQVSAIDGDVELYDIKLNVPWNESISQELVQGMDDRFARSGVINRVEDDNRDFLANPNTRGRRNQQWALVKEGGHGVRILSGGIIDLVLPDSGYGWAPGVMAHGTGTMGYRDEDYEDEYGIRSRNSQFETHIFGEPQWKTNSNRTGFSQRALTDLRLSRGEGFGLVVQGVIIVKINLSPAEQAVAVAEAAAALAEATALAAAEAAVVAILLADSIAARAASDAALIIRDTAQGQFDFFRGNFDLDPSNFNRNRLTQAQNNLDTARNSYNALEAVAVEREAVYLERANP